MLKVKIARFFNTQIFQLWILFEHVLYAYTVEFCTVCSAEPTICYTDGFKGVYTSTG